MRAAPLRGFRAARVGTFRDNHDADARGLNSVRRILFLPLWLVAAALLAYLLGVGFGPLQGFMGRWAFLVLEIGGPLACLARAARVREERAAWAVLGAGGLLWGLGDLYFRVALYDLESPTVPSPADGLWLTFYPCAYTGIVLLMRARTQRLRATVWIDGMIAALAVAAVAAAIVFNAVLENVGGAPIETATNLSYPLMDGILLALVAAAFAVTGWRLDRTWITLAAALAVFAVSDSVYLYQIARDTYTAGGVLDAGWAMALFLMGIAAWRCDLGVKAGSRADSWRSLVMPVLFGLVAIGIETYDHFERISVPALVLTGACLVAVIGRLMITFSQNLHMLRKSRLEAATDPLTGLANRRQLAIDLDGVLSAPNGEASALLVLFDLNGFKLYNDTFGHPAGDDLLKRLGRRLGDRIEGRGKAYRMGGDEFCALVELETGTPEVLVAHLADGLYERGEAFSIDCSYGTAVLPAEAHTPEAALRTVDQRMYAQKQGGRTSARSQSKEVLLQALVERSPSLGRHFSDVADLAAATARSLGVSGSELEHIRAAGELHDIGKVAIPDAILDKPGPLNGAEWEFVKRHSTVGERIVAAAPALAEVARLVRCVHERVDGTGYPEGLAGTDIPLGARIIAVCDAYDAMTSERPYRRPMSHTSAIAELRRNAGGQFDREVVIAFCRAYEAQAPGSDDSLQESGEPAVL